jgi:hypothetical protein
MSPGRYGAEDQSMLTGLVLAVDELERNVKLFGISAFLGDMDDGKRDWAA